MKNILLAVFLFICYSVDGQVINKIPQYGFQNNLSVGRTSDNDTIAYFQVGPNTGGNKGIIFPRVANVSALVGTPKKGLIIYDDSKDSIGYYNGVNWIYPGASSTLKTVADTTARNAIAAEDRYEGMLVYVTDVQKYYSLKGGILNSNWTELAQGETTIISTGTGVFIDNF